MTTEVTETQKGQLRVTHKDEGNHLARGIKLALDGKELTVLKSGKAIVIDIEPGSHTLRVDNTFHSKNIEFEIKPGEQAHYRIWNKRGFGSWMVELFGAGPMYLAIEKAEPVESASLPLTPTGSEQAAKQR
jgi:hypothetical protein